MEKQQQQQRNTCTKLNTVTLLYNSSRNTPKTWNSNSLEKCLLSLEMRTSYFMYFSFLCSTSCTVSISADFMLGVFCCCCLPLVLINTCKWIKENCYNHLKHIVSDECMVDSVWNGWELAKFIRIRQLTQQTSTSTMTVAAISVIFFGIFRIFRIFDDWKQSSNNSHLMHIHHCSFKPRNVSLWLLCANFEKLLPICIGMRAAFSWNYLVDRFRIDSNYLKLWMSLYHVSLL